MPLQPQNEARPYGRRHRLWHAAQPWLGLPLLVLLLLPPLGLGLAALVLWRLARWIW